MGCLPTWRRTQLKARLAVKKTQLIALYAEYDKAIANIEVQSYKFDSGEGSQQTKRRAPEEIAKAIERLEKEIDSITSKLNGTGIVSMNLRRR